MLVSLPFNKTDIPYILTFSILILLCIDIEEKQLEIKYKRIIDIIDQYSYALYLMQGVFICSFVDPIKKIISDWQVGLIVIVGTLLFTIIGHNYIEMPLQKVLKII